MAAEKLRRGVDAEVAKARARLEQGGDPLHVLETLSVSLTNKLMHPAMQALNSAGSTERATLAASIASLYFGSDR